MYIFTSILFGKISNGSRGLEIPQQDRFEHRTWIVPGTVRHTLTDIYIYIYIFNKRYINMSVLIRSLALTLDMH